MKLLCLTALQGENEASMPWRMGPTFVGFHRHRFILAIHDLISEHSDTVAILKCLMKIQALQIPMAKLKRITPLIVKTSTVTRKSCTNDMMSRFKD